MGQKTNSNIFRLGIKKNEWNSKYFEKNKQESTLYAYQNLQIQSYLNQFFKRNGLIVQNFKLYFSGTNLHIFISYYSTKKSFFSMNKYAPNKFIKFKSKKQETLNKQERRQGENLKLSKFLNCSEATVHAGKSNKKLLIKNKRLKIVNSYKKFLNSKTCDNNEFVLKNNFLEQLLESLSVFTNKKFHIFLTFQSLNRGLSIKLSSAEQNFLRKKIIFFKQYSKNRFFKESLNIVLIMTKTRNSAKLFSYFLANHIKTLKRHNHFLIFIKRILTLFVGTKFSKLEGVKIIINGRFNGAPRSKNRLIQVGNIPIQTIEKNINYYQTTSFTKNGTFGIKVWISLVKTPSKNCFYNQNELNIRKLKRVN